ncbi:MAG: YciI family protein [Pikeienuella sp.]
MAKFVFAFHGGGMPETPEEGEKVMAAWGAWMQGLGAALVNGGAPVGMSKTVHAGGVNDDGGSNPLSGYSVVEAPDMDAAIVMAQGCPILQSGGSVEVAQEMEM